MNFIKSVSMFLICIILFSGCSQKNEKSDKLIVFHAGSLSVPLKQVKEEFAKLHPGVNIVLEAAGSRTCARKITDLKKDCDVMLSADYTVIDNILIPEYADWCIPFITNQMSIAYNDKSKYADLINSDNWYDILMKKDVICGASNPNDDPCGYRTILMLKLAQTFYHVPNIEINIYNNDSMRIRPKETDLIALLETNTIDYMFIYKSVAVQHGLKYIELPNEINLGNPADADFYKLANVSVSGQKPGEFITKEGGPIVYGLTIPKNAPNPELAKEFVEFVLSPKGMNIFKENGQNSVVPEKTKTYDKIPDDLKKYAK